MYFMHVMNEYLHINLVPKSYFHMCLENFKLNYPVKSFHVVTRRIKFIKVNKKNNVRMQ